MNNKKEKPTRNSRLKLLTLQAATQEMQNKNYENIVLPNNSKALIYGRILRRIAMIAFFFKPLIVRK